MRGASSTDFKGRAERISSAHKKLEAAKSQSAEDIPHTTSVSKLSTKLQDHATTSSHMGRHPRRPLTGKKNKEINGKEVSGVNNAEEEKHASIVQVDPEAIIERLLQNSHKIKELMQQYSLSEEQVATKLLEPLFTLSLVAFVSKNRLDITEAENLKRVERFVLERISQECQFSRQASLCEEKETKIMGMIEERLKRLSQL